MTEREELRALVAVVQYRRKEQVEYDPWHTMAAFDSKHVAERYSDDCSKVESPWEYRAIDLADGEE